MQIDNVSSQRLFVQHRKVPTAIDPGGAAAMPVGPGKTLTLDGRADGLPSGIWLYSQPADAGSKGRTLFWQGHVPPGAVIDADPGTGQVTWNGKSFDEDHLARARAMAGDGSLDNVTLEDLRAHAESQDPAAPTIKATVASAALLSPQQFSDCELAISGVVLDAVLLVFGFGSLIKTLDTPVVANQLASTIGSAGIDAQRDAIDAMAATAPGGMTMAAKVFGIIQELGSTALPSVFMAIFSNLSLLDKALHFGLAGAQSAAIFASGGTWAIPFIVIQLSINGFLLGKRITTCYLTCNPGKQPPAVPRTDPEGSFIVMMDGRRLIPSTDDNPRILMAADVGIYSDGLDLWDIQPYAGNTSATEPVVTLRCLAYPDLYIVAPQGIPGTLLTVNTLEAVGGIGSGNALWTPTWYPSTTAPTSDALPGYALVSQSYEQVALAMYIENIKASLYVLPSTTPDASHFFFRDTRKGSFDLSNEFQIGWRLELFGVDSDWSFWNGTSDSGVSLPAQEGTLLRPDDANYWSVVAMARSSGIKNGIAQIRCWSDASGRYIQAGFNAYGTWVKYGKQDPYVSIASDESLGAVLCAWIMHDEDAS